MPEGAADFVADFDGGDPEDAPVKSTIESIALDPSGTPLEDMDDAAPILEEIPTTPGGHDIGSSEKLGVTPEGIAILGSHPQTVEMAPFNENWLIWSCSPHNYEQRDLPRFDRWFEIHIPVEDRTRCYRYLKYVQTLPDVVMRDEKSMGAFPGAKPYPEKEMKDIFGPFTFTSTIAFMLAAAIIECEQTGIRQIGLFGIMQASETEYAYQRPGIQNLIWEATKRGIKVVAPDISKLFEPQPEGF